MTVHRPTADQAPEDQPPNLPLFVVAGLALVAAEIAWALKIDDTNRSTLREAMQQGRVLFVWADGSERSFLLAFAVGIIGFSFLRLIFSRAARVRPRHAWIAFSVWGLTLTGLNLWSLSAPVGGYADAAGATWIDRHTILDRKPWSAATAIAVACRTGKGHSSLTYDVAFGRRKARLADFVFPGGAARWLPEVRAVEPVLPAGVTFSRGTFDRRCLSAYSRDLGREDVKALVALYRPTRDHARWMAEEDAAWGRVFEEVVAEQARAPRRESLRGGLRLR